jgi:hypothetical protein
MASNVSNAVILKHSSVRSSRHVIIKIVCVCLCERARARDPACRFRGGPAEDYKNKQEKKLMSNANIVKLRIKLQIT